MHLGKTKQHIFSWKHRHPRSENRDSWLRSNATSL